VREGANAVLNWSGGGPPYSVQHATDLTMGGWVDVLIDATPPFTVPVGSPNGFYRIVGH
jgi:hypothetical protein